MSLQIGNSCSYNCMIPYVLDWQKFLSRNKSNTIMKFSVYSSLVHYRGTRKRQCVFLIRAVLCACINSPPLWSLISTTRGQPAEGIYQSPAPIAFIVMQRGRLSCSFKAAICCPRGSHTHTHAFVCGQRCAEETAGALFASTLPASQAIGSPTSLRLRLFLGPSHEGAFPDGS